jgi:hypothetical protein
MMSITMMMMLMMTFRRAGCARLLGEPADEAVKFGRPDRGTTHLPRLQQAILQLVRPALRRRRPRRGARGLRRGAAVGPGLVLLLPPLPRALVVCEALRRGVQRGLQALRTQGRRIGALGGRGLRGDELALGQLEGAHLPVSGLFVVRDHKSYRGSGA